jgi:hypothetical protein
VPSIKANTPSCDTRAKAPLWGQLCAAFAAAFAIEFPISAPQSQRHKPQLGPTPKADKNMRQ